MASSLTWAGPGPLLSSPLCAVPGPSSARPLRRREGEWGWAQKGEQPPAAGRGGPRELGAWWVSPRVLSVAVGHSKPAPASLPPGGKGRGAGWVALENPSTLSVPGTMSSPSPQPEVSPPPHPRGPSGFPAGKVARLRALPVCLGLLGASSVPPAWRRQAFSGGGGAGKRPCLGRAGADSILQLGAILPGALGSLRLGAPPSQGHRPPGEAEQGLRLFPQPKSQDPPFPLLGLRALLVSCQPSSHPNFSHRPLAQVPVREGHHRPLPRLVWGEGALCSSGEGFGSLGPGILLGPRPGLASACLSGWSGRRSPSPPSCQWADAPSAHTASKRPQKEGLWGILEPVLCWEKGLPLVPGGQPREVAHPSPWPGPASLARGTGCSDGKRQPTEIDLLVNSDKQSHGDVGGWARS